MVNERIVKLIERLHQRTMDGKITWEQTNIEGVFQIAFPEYSLKISKSESSHDYSISIFLQIYNKDGILIEGVHDGQLMPMIPFSTMEELYYNARRTAMGVDKAIDDILSELD